MGNASSGPANLFIPEDDPRLRFTYSLAGLVSLLLTALAVLYCLKTPGALTWQALVAIGFLLAISVLLGGYSGRLQFGTIVIKSKNFELSASAGGKNHEAEKS